MTASYATGASSWCVQGAHSACKYERCTCPHHQEADDAA